MVKTEIFFLLNIILFFAAFKKVRRSWRTKDQEHNLNIITEIITLFLNINYMFNSYILYVAQRILCEDVRLHMPPGRVTVNAQRG